MGRARTPSASSHTRTESNTLYAANDLGVPRIMSLRTDEEQVVGELCQLTNLNHRMRHGGCLAQVGIRGGAHATNATRRGSDRVACWGLHEGWPADLFFAIALLFSPQLARRSATQRFDGRGQFLRRCICSSLYFLVMAFFRKFQLRISVSSKTW
jgi:hypothetical protein